VHARQVTIKPIAEDELAAWIQAMDTGFLIPTPDGAEAYVKEFLLPGRTLGGFDGRDCVATLRSLDLELTIPGGACVPAEGITNVAVVPSHRRRGLLGQLMRVACDDAMARGHGLSALIAAEYWIYGRYGYGPATRILSCDIDVRRAGRITMPGGQDCTIEPISLADVRGRGAALHDRFRPTQPGAIDRSSARWRVHTGDLRSPYRDARPQPTAVLCRDSDGTPAGLALFHVDDAWRGGDPDFTLTVDDMFALHPRASAALWQHLLTMDWVTRISASNIAPDDSLPLLVDNPRAISTSASTGRDHLWLRILDVPTALQARRYDAAGTLTLDIADRLGYAAGRFELSAGQDGRATVTVRASKPADLALDVSALGSLYLGDRTVAQLAAAGKVTELRAGALRRAAQLLRTAVRPWCADNF
jgi:predicted acetyltransferase